MSHFLFLDILDIQLNEIKNEAKYVFSSKTESASIHMLQVWGGLDLFYSPFSFLHHVAVSVDDCGMKMPTKVTAELFYLRYHIARSLHDLISPLSFLFLSSPPCCVFYSICKTHQHNVWVVATSLSCTSLLNFTAE